MNNRYLQTLGMNPPPGIPEDYPYRPTPMPTSNPLYISGVGFAPNMSTSPYPSTAFTSGNLSNSSYPAASSSYFLVPNNPYLVFTSPYPASFNNPNPASTSHYPANSNSAYPASFNNPNPASTSHYLASSNSAFPASFNNPKPASTSHYLASSNSAYPASSSAFSTSSNSCYPTSCNSPHPVYTLAYTSSSDRHYPASTSSYLATSYPAPASTNQSLGTSPYPSMGSRAYDSKFRPNIMNNRCPQTPSMNPPSGIPRDYPYRPTPMLTSNPLYPSGVGFAPNMSASPYPSTAFTSGHLSNSSYPAASSSYLLVPNNPYLVFTSPYPANFNNPYPASTLQYPASSNSAYPASTSAFPTSSNSCYPTSCNCPNPAPTSAYPSSSDRHYPASTSSYLATSYPASASTDVAPGASPYPSMGSRTSDSKFRPSVNESNDDAFNINAFPNEIVLEIFGYLTQNQLGQIARVCKRWNVLTKSPLLWKNVDVIFSPFHRSQTTVATSFIKGLPSCVASIRLDFMKCRSWYVPLDFAELCLKLQENCPRLEQLILIHSEISISFCSVIHLCSQFLQDLKNLIFHYSGFCCYRPTGECFGISKIKILELFKGYIDSSSKSPFSKMPHLEQLHLYGTRLGNSWFKDDTSFLNQLHVLNVGGTKITAETFQAIQNHGHNLKELYLCSSFLQDLDLNFNNSPFPHLKTICLFCPYPLTCEGIVSLIQSCPSLQNVYVAESMTEFFAAHPFVVANICKAGIVKAIDWNHNHNVDYSHT